MTDTYRHDRGNNKNFTEKEGEILGLSTSEVILYMIDSRLVRIHFVKRERRKEN